MHRQLPFLVNPVQGTVIVRGGMQGTWIVFEVADGVDPGRAHRTRCITAAC